MHFLSSFLYIQGGKIIMTTSTGKRTSQAGFRSFNSGLRTYFTPFRLVPPQASFKQGDFGVTQPPICSDDGFGVWRLVCSMRRGAEWGALIGGWRLWERQLGSAPLRPGCNRKISAWTRGKTLLRMQTHFRSRVFALEVSTFVSGLTIAINGSALRPLM